MQRVAAGVAEASRAAEADSRTLETWRGGRAKRPSRMQPRPLTLALSPPGERGNLVVPSTSGCRTLQGPVHIAGGVEADEGCGAEHQRGLRRKVGPVLGA